MPYESEAQRKKMNAMAARGEISQSTVDEWNQKSKGKKLPKYKKGSGLAKWAKARANE